MAVRIRLKRMGRRHRAYYRIVAVDARSPRDGRFLESLGTYDPHRGGKNYSFDRERMLYWLGVGAQVSEAVAPFLEKEGIAPGKRVRGAKAPRKKA